VRFRERVLNGAESRSADQRERGGLIVVDFVRLDVGRWGPDVGTLRTKNHTLFHNHFTENLSAARLASRSGTAKGEDLTVKICRSTSPLRSPKRILLLHRLSWRSLQHK
jgi:hypothetical protein